MKLLMLEITKLDDALKCFDRNKMPPLYKGDKNVYTLDEMKAFCDATHKIDDSFANWVENKFEDKFSNFFKEMIKVEK